MFILKLNKLRREIAMTNLEAVNVAVEVMRNEINRIEDCVLEMFFNEYHRTCDTMKSAEERAKRVYACEVLSRILSKFFGKMEVAKLYRWHADIVLRLQTDARAPAREIKEFEDAFQVLERLNNDLLEWRRSFEKVPDELWNSTPEYLRYFLVDYFSTFEMHEELSVFCGSNARYSKKLKDFAIESCL